jgi:hypothetical protein
MTVDRRQCLIETLVEGFKSFGVIANIHRIDLLQFCAKLFYE